MTRSPLTRRLLLCLTLLSLILTAPATQAAVVERALPLDSAWDVERPTGRWLADVCADPDADRSLAPTLTWYWMLEDGERLAAAELIVEHEESVGLLAREAKRLPLIGSDGTVAPATRGGALWSTDYRVELGAPQRLHGRLVQAITLTPFRSEAGALVALKNASLRLTSAASGESASLLRPERPDFPLRDRLEARFGDLLLNPEVLPESPGDRAVGGGGFPTEVPGVEGATVAMVIVTPDSFADLCETYAQARTNQGVPTVVRSLEWIAEHYPMGSDPAEMIRRFTQDAYAKWSLEYLLLVGDANIIPPRYAFTEIFGEGGTESPTDMYYACLDGDWNADHDAHWAEAADTLIDDPGDVTDWLAEITVGRLPARTRSECSTLLNKQGTYHAAGMTPYQQRMLMLGEVLFPTDWVPGQNIIIDGAAYCESIYVKYTGPQHQVVRLYENLTEYPGSLPLTVESALDSMANGFNIVLHNGHGQRQTMRVGNGSIDNTMAVQLDNGNRTFLLYMINCTAGAFDYNSIAEAFAKNPNGGAWAVIGSTRETFANISALYMDVFFSLLYYNPNLRLGDLYSASLAYYNGETLVDSGHRWAHSTFTLLADPSNWLHYAAVGSLQTTLPSSIALGSGPLTFTVTKGFGIPLVGAKVTLRKGDEDYQWANTNGSGQVSFNLKAETVGTYHVNVEARDYRPYSGMVSVTAPVAAPRPYIAAATVNDTSGGSVVGNGNGIPERGETVQLTLTLTNGGTASATAVAGTLTTSSPHLTILDGTDSYGTIAQNASASGSNPYLIEVLDSAVDDEILPFALAISTGQGAFNEDFFLEAAAAELGLHASTLDDAVGGDGDDEIEDGESADFALYLDNWGRGDAVAVQAEAFATAGSSLSINTGALALGTLPALSSNLGPAVFNVTRSGSNPPELLVVLSDAYGHLDSLTLVIERPQGDPWPPSYAFGEDPTRLRLNWEPGVVTGVGGYRVFRAEQAEGPYQLISTEWVENATYEDGGLPPFTSYWYRIQPLSAAGLAGALSDSSKVTTQLPMREGWPQTVGMETASTPIVGDFNGDGVNEIFVAADKVYGFKLDGSELSDGDNNSLTHGVISSLGSNFRNCPLAAADLTDSPGLELVAGSWDTGQVIVWEFVNGPGGIQAQLAPGWPKLIANPNGYGIWAAPALADIDGDRRLEILVTDVGGYLNAWNGDGTVVAGFPKSGIGNWTRSTTGLADIDGDGDCEIFLPTSGGQLRGYQGNGSTLSGFPKTGMSAIFSSPAIGDIDDDGFIEIVVAAENDSVYAFNHTGSRVTGWPKRLVNNNDTLKAPSPALADVTGDGVPEIFVVSVTDNHNTSLGWLDVTGAWLPGWPQMIVDHSQSGATVGDLDGDGDFEVVLPHESGKIDAWHHDGTPVDGFPLVTSEFARSAATLVDVDEDGLLDLVFVGWDRNVYIWEFPTAYDPAMTPWYTYMHDFKRTGNTSTIDWVVGVDDDDPLPAGRVLRLDDNWPNPFNPSTNIRFTVGGASSQAVRLEIYDLRGRRLRSLAAGNFAPGTYLHNWDGRDDAGSELPSGIYFARLKVGRASETKKLTLLK